MGTAGDIDARGWGVGMTQEVSGYMRGTIEYTVATAYWQPSVERGRVGARRDFVGIARRRRTCTICRATIEATIPQTSTKIYARYRMSTAFWSPEAERLASPTPTRASTCV